MKEDLRTNEKNIIEDEGIKCGSEIDEFIGQKPINMGDDFITYYECD
ncbi:MAG: hypothetical protein R6U95_07895 [Bacteroidales bacterium]